MGRFLEYNFSGEGLHFFESLAQLAVIAYRGFHFPELFSRQRDRDGFLGHFAGPLIAGTPARALGAVLHGTLADVAHLA